MTSPLTQIGDYASQIGAEIVAFDDVREFLYVVSGDTVLQVLEFSDPTTLREIAAIDLADYGVPIGGANSVAYRNGLVAIAIQAVNKTDPGLVAVINVDAILTAADIPAATKVFTVGSLPDMVTFTPDGTKVLVANEGEPDGSVDPEGSISIINVSGDFAGLSQANVATANFQGFNAQKSALQASGVRFFPDATVAQDVEPEYIAVSPDGTTAFVTLQENNAIAIVDIATATVTSIKPLGLKDFSLAGNGIDASDRDGGINIKQQPVFGLYMPDSISAFEVNGQPYYVIANEGDDRGDAEASGRGDAIRLKDISKVVSFGRSGLTLDPALIATLGPDALKDENLGRLTISSIDGDTDGDGDLDQIVAYGGRSFSVLDSAGNIIFDSGDQLEQITAQRSPDFFNANESLAAEKDTRSDNKGPEPEAITTGIIDGKPYAFVGLERAGGGVLMYDLSNPTRPEFIQYIRDDKDVAPEGFQFITADKSPTGQPLLVAANEVSKTIAVYQVPQTLDPATFTLQLLHLSDQEAGIPALDDAPRASAVINALRDDYANTLLLSSGDAFIPGLFASASADIYGGSGRADILIQNELGMQAIAFGNHDFDFGTAVLRDLIKGSVDNPATPDINEAFVGTRFPYLSSNLDFSTDPNLAELVVPDDQAPKPNSIAASVVIDVNGEKIGVVGATTPLLRTISSPGTVGVSPQPFDGIPTDAQLDALAAEIQKDVDELLAANPRLNKVVVLSHMQQISIEQALATRLKNVDVIVAGGSNTRLLDDDDRLRPGDTKQGEYPIFSTDADGKPIAIVNTDGNYKYVGRLVVDFDANGNIIPGSYDSAVSGAYATDAQGVADLNAQSLVDPEIQAIVDALRTNIVAKESNVFGLSDVFLNGDRGGVRIEETNFGNLTADANLAVAQQTDATTVISLKNGGGIRNSIGQVIVPTGGTGGVVRLPTEAVTDANGNIVKPAGGISQNDIANSLSFNNGLSLITITAAELLTIIEHGVAASTADDSNTQGRFPQVAGIEFSFDLTQPANDRVQSLVVLNENGNDADVIVRNGALVGDPTRTFRMVTLGFLATGGDGYPFPTGPAANIVNLTQADSVPRTGQATFAADGSEQDALAEYFATNFRTTPFAVADAPRNADTRIQNLAFRADTVIDSLIAPTVGFNSNNLFAIAGNGITQLKATLTGRISETVGEIIVIATDDENGTIDGNAPGSAGYQAAALARATVVLSTLSAGEFGGLDPMRTIDVTGGQFLQFATIKGGTLGDVVNGRGGEIIFATPAANSNGQSAIASPNALNDQSVQVSFRLPGSNRNDITLDLTLGNTPKPLGSEIQGENAESEIIDLTGIAAPSINATVEVFREAGFNNVVGFYGIEDKAGTVIDPLTGNSLTPGEAGYVKAALANRVDLTLTGENGRTSQFSATLATGRLLSTFLVVDGTIDALLDTNTTNDPTIYFNHIGMNSDGKDHVRLLGDNTFGFEDLAGGGDMDFDDVIVKMSFV